MHLLNVRTPRPPEALESMMLSPVMLVFAETNDELNIQGKKVVVGVL